MRLNHLLIRACLPALLLFALNGCLPAKSNSEHAAGRLDSANQDAHSMIDKYTYAQGDAYKKRLHGAVELALATNAWQMAVYASPEADVQAAADTVRQVVGAYFPSIHKAAVLDEIRDAAKWKANPSTATVPPAMLALELENNQQKDESVLFEVAFMRFSAMAGCETIRTGLVRQQESVVNLGKVILENTLNNARDRFTQIPRGYPEKLDAFVSRLKEDKLNGEDSLNIQEEEMDRWFADLTDMLLQTWAEG